MLVKKAGKGEWSSFKGGRQVLLDWGGSAWVPEVGMYSAAQA